MKTKDGLAVVAYAPCVVETEIQGKPVKLEVKTEYPFRDAVELTVTVPEPLTFDLALRVPEWSPPLSISSDAVTARLADPGRREGAGYQMVAGDWKGSTALRFALTAEVRLYRGAGDSVALERGPLVFALPIGAEWKKLRDQPRFADWEVLPTTPWNYALEIDPADPAKSVTVKEEPLNANGARFAAKGAPISMSVKGRRLEGWKLEKGAAAAPPQGPVRSDAPLEELKLIPYGCTDLRITEFPTLDRSTGR
jgi:hypothetical protein